MADDKRREPLRKKPPDSDQIAAQPTRREQAEPSNQIVLSDSDFYSAAHSTQVGVKTGVPEKIGQYQVIRELGRGGMGVVYLAKQPSLNREVALKVLNINLQSDPEDAARFTSEAKLAASLQHPNIVQIYAIGEQDGYAFMAMEYVAGGSLHQYLKSHSPSPREAAELLEPIARAMQHAHSRGIIHRDLKPGNILIGEAELVTSDSKPHSNSAKPLSKAQLELENGKSIIPKITDFGLAKNLNQSMHLTATGVALGTPSYMAPEQARDDRKFIGPLSDVYAMGAILYELLTGKPPFSGSTPIVTMQQVVRTRPVPPSTIRPSVPKELEQICLKCLEKNTKNRYASAQELADALRRFLNGEVVEPIVALQPVRGYLFTLVLLIITLASIATALYFWRAYENEKRKNIEMQKASIESTPIVAQLSFALSRSERRHWAKSPLN